MPDEDLHGLSKPAFLSVTFHRARLFDSFFLRFFDLLFEFVDVLLGGQIHVGDDGLERFSGGGSLFGFELVDLPFQLFIEIFALIDCQLSFFYQFIRDALCLFRRTGQGKLYLFVAIDRTSKFVTAKLYDRATMKSAKEFLAAWIKVVPYRIHTILTDNGIQFADLPKNRTGATAVLRGHSFDRSCRINGIEHRLTKPNHPWTNGQVERMTRTIKEATVNRYYYQTREELQKHLNVFIAAYNFAKRLKTIHGLTPYEFIVKSWSEKLGIYHLNPSHLNLGLYNYYVSLIRKNRKASGHADSLWLQECATYISCDF